MRKLFLIAISLFIWLGAWAQSTKNVLEIDPASFRPVQTDALSGVAIDKIGLDRSKRPCARIKMHVNRMTREEIDQISVRPIGGMVELTKKSTAIEGNGIIFEITAKEQVRFYLHHDKYGDSNEVSVNLEGHKEYRLEAQLNLLLPITVASNVTGADVYLDNVFKGQIGDNYMLTIEDVVPGNHRIAIKYGVSTSEEIIDVNSGKVSFRIEVNSQSSRPQYVMFEVEPKYATVFINNEPQVTQEGYVTAVLQNGTYNYRVIAKGYHEQSGTFTVSGEKVKRTVVLTADAAMVSISAGNDCEIWVNNERKGASPWRGQLLSGTYIFEARKAGHRTTSLSQTISSTPKEQNYQLDAPAPIIGILNATSVPADADVYVDGKLVGQTPLFTDMLEGKHKVSIRKNGYKLFEQDATIVEGKSTVVVAMMEEGETAEVTAAPLTTKTTTATTTSTTTQTKTTSTIKTEPEKRSGEIAKNYNRYGYKNSKGELVLSYDYDMMFESDGYIFARINHKTPWGMYDLEGNLILPHIYKDVSRYSNEGLRAICKNGKWGYIDEKGNVIIDFKYRKAENFSEGLAAVKKGRYGYINKAGQVVIPFRHKHAGEFHNGIARVSRQAGYQHLLWSVFLPGPGFLLTGMFMSMGHEKYGYIDTSGTLIIPKKYDIAPAEFNNNGLARVNCGNKTFYIDKRHNKYKTESEALRKLSLNK